MRHADHSIQGSYRRLALEMTVDLAILYVVMYSMIATLAHFHLNPDDAEFMRSMIPHHSGAVVTCEQAAISDAAIVELCGEIVKSQSEEIARIKRLLQWQ